MNQYEAMFLFDPTFGSSFEDCEAEVRRLCVARSIVQSLCYPHPLVIFTIATILTYFVSRGK